MAPILMAPLSDGAPGSGVCGPFITPLMCQLLQINVQFSCEMLDACNKKYYVCKNVVCLYKIKTVFGEIGK